MDKSHLIGIALCFVVIAYAPIVVLQLILTVRPPWLVKKLKNTECIPAQIVLKVVMGLVLTFLYGYALPIWVAGSNFPSLNSLIMPEPMTNPNCPCNDTFEFLNGYVFFLVALLGLLIALASQQAGYVNRLSDIINDKRVEAKTLCRSIEGTTKINVAYHLASCGFWGFSFAVVVTGGLIGVHLFGKSEYYSAYEALIAALIGLGWPLLLSTALRSPAWLARN